MRKLTLLALALISTSAIAGNVDESGAKKKSGGEIYVSANTRDLKAPYGQPVKAGATHVLNVKNIFNTNMTYEYYYSLKVNNQHTDQKGVITLGPYEERKLQLESAIYNIVFNRGKYPIVACTATIETGTYCDHKTLTVY